jgi:hypothetical protein
VKKAALRAAVAYVAGTESEHAQAEAELKVGLVSRGLITIDEYDKLAHFDYDGLPDEKGNYFPHVYVYLRGEREAVLDITCDI